MFQLALNKSPSLTQTLPMNADSVAVQRLKRLECFIVVCVLVWTAFWLYYWYAGHVICSVVCLFQAISLSVVLFLTGNNLKRRRLIANMFLLNCMLGLALNSLVQGQSLSYSFMFAPFICLAAAHLMGVRAALAWAGALVTTTCVVYFLPLPVHFAELPSVWDKFAINVGLTITIYLLSQQAEHFFTERTSHLMTLTEGLHEKTRMLELAEETAGVGHWRWDVQTELVSFSNEIRRICGLEMGEGPQPLDDLLETFSPDDAERLNHALIEAYRKDKSFVLELTFRKNNELKYVNCRGFCERDLNGSITSVFGIMRDDTELKKATARLKKKATALKHLASFDPLTGLANRFKFERTMKLLVKKAIKTNEPIALMILDMDGFKEVNDTLGHQMGDRVLKETATRLLGVLDSKHIVSRFGGDEFTIIITEFKDDEELVKIGYDIINAIRRPYRLDGRDLVLGASIGVSICPRDSHQTEATLAFADTAMYEAKMRGNEIVVYRASMTEALVRRKAIEERLSFALERNEFMVHFQPQVEMQSNQIIGFEALLRWKKGNEFVPPVEFIPILENSGEIVEVGYWILEECCRYAEKWNGMGHEITIAVNISAIQFREPNFVERAIDIMSKYDIRPDWIDLEITESLLVDEIDKTADKLFELKSFGNSISIDDFGTGYSSLAYLKHFPIDKLKIDRTFVQDVPEHDDGTIAASIIVLGKTLDLKILAEGVETVEQLEFIKSHGCDSYQGYLTSPPLPPNACERMLEQQCSNPTVQSS